MYICMYIHFCSCYVWTQNAVKRPSCAIHFEWTCISVQMPSVHEQSLPPRRRALKCSVWFVYGVSKIRTLYSIKPIHKSHPEVIPLALGNDMRERKKITGMHDQWPDTLLHGGVKVMFRSACQSPLKFRPGVERKAWLLAMLGSRRPGWRGR